MDSRLHQSDKRDSRALIPLSLSLLLALILLLFYLISETRAERSDDAPCVDKMNGATALSFAPPLSSLRARTKRAPKSIRSRLRMINSKRADPAPL